MTAVIIDSGGANLASLQFALQRLGCQSEVSADPSIIRAANHVFLPGVGAAGDTMQRLRSTALDRLIPSLQQPVLGICLGMQILAQSSRENETACLDLLPGSAELLLPEAGRPVPHMGWNQLQHSGEGLFSGIPQGAYAYFVHSYALATGDYVTASVTYGTQFAAAVQRDNFYGTQFHPERSGLTGSRILKNFLALPSCN